MYRSLVALALGAAIGAAAVLYAVNESRDARAPQASRDDAALVPAPASPNPARPRAAQPTDDAASSQRPGSIAARAELYRAAAEADVRRIRSLLERSAAQQPSAERDFALDVLVRRYAELDPEDAVAAARELHLGPRALAPLYAEWAKSDAAHALESLSELDVGATTVAVAVVEALGNDEAAFDQVLGALPNTDEATLRRALTDARAEAAPEVAFADALGLDGAARDVALESVAAAWAGADVHAALAAADTIADPLLQRVFRSRVLFEWGRLDADGFLDYVAALPPEQQRDFLTAGGGGGRPWLGRANPQHALALLDRLPAEMRPMIVFSVAQSYAAEDPVAALRYAETLPPQLRQQVLQMVAGGYARRDPDAAIAWARGLGPGQSMVLAQVLAVVAQTDPNRAIDVALALPPQERDNALRMVAMNAASNPAADPGPIAERLLEIGNRQVRDMTSQALFSMWGNRDPEAALEWLLGHRDRAPVIAYSGIAPRFAANDPQSAASYTSRVPAEARGAWIQGVARGYAAADPQNAVAWIEQFRGDPAYAAGMTAIVQGMAQADPPAAAALLESLPRSDGGPTVTMVAHAWTQRDPPAAAEWALGLDAPQTRDATLRIVTSQWAAQDYEAARDWVTRLPTGAVRDASLSTLIASMEEPDPTLMSAFSDAQARERGIVEVLWGVAARNPQRARDLVDRYVTDATLRAQAERTLESAKSGVNQGVMIESSIGFGGPARMPAVRTPASR